jgi:hypothetical protein
MKLENTVLGMVGALLIGSAALAQGAGPQTQNMSDNERHFFECNSYIPFAGLKKTFSPNESLLLVDYDPSDKRGIPPKWMSMVRQVTLSMKKALLSQQITLPLQLE